MLINETEIRNKIKQYQKKIVQLEKDNKKIKNNIKDSEEAFNKVSEMINRTEKKLNDELMRIKRLVSMLPKNAKFANYYYENAKKVLFSNSSDKGLSSLKETKKKIIQKIDCFEDDYTNNIERINYYLRKIQVLKQQLNELTRSGK